MSRHDKEEYWDVEPEFDDRKNASSCTTNLDAAAAATSPGGDLHTGAHKPAAAAASLSRAGAMAAAVVSIRQYNLRGFVSYSLFVFRDQYICKQVLMV